MHWKSWLKIAPTDWSLEDKLEFINKGLNGTVRITMEELKAAIANL